MRIRQTSYFTKAMGIVIMVAGALSVTAMAGPGGGGHGGGGGFHGGGGGGFHGGGGGFHSGGGGFHGGGFGRGGFRGGYSGGFHGGGYGGGFHPGGFRGGYGGGYRGGGFRGGYGGPFHAGGFRGGYGGPFHAGGFRGGYGGGFGGGWYRGGYGPWGYWGGWGLGLSVPFLPLGYSTYYWGGLPYYYADDALYSWDADTGEYITVAPPDGSPDVAPPNSSAATATTVDLYAYPKAGQSEEQQARDKDDCRKWAGAQNGGESSQTPSDSAAVDSAHASYVRAEAACLEARNYSVK